MRRAQLLTGVLFILLVGIGVSMSSHRPLWRDEFFSLVFSISRVSYPSMAMGHITDGNNSPLFYLLQKAQWDLLSYHPPSQWLRGQDFWGAAGDYAFDQVFLRIQSVVFMSAALCALFYYFIRRYSLLTGFYVLALALSSSVVWSHLDEMRPYALWFALSVFQMLFLLDVLKTPAVDNTKQTRWLALTHCLLALTVTISAVQIIAAGCVLWIWRQRSWKFFISAVFVPLGMILFYYFSAVKCDFFFINGPLSLISANFPKERLLLALIFVVVFIYDQRGKNKWVLDPPAGYLVFMALMMVFFALLLAKLKLGDKGYSHGFQVSGRYFTSLAPMSIIGTAIFSVYLMRVSGSRVWKTAVIVILAGFLVFRFHKVEREIPINLNLFSSAPSKVSLLARGNKDHDGTFYRFTQL